MLIRVPHIDIKFILVMCIPLRCLELIVAAPKWVCLKSWGYLGGCQNYLGIMEKKMETTIMENQMEKKMENEMETREYTLFGSVL